MAPQEYRRDVMERKIILASKSPRRKELLSGLISEFEVRPDTAPEVVEAELSPEETVKRLALQKAENVAKISEDDALIIAADTVVFIDGEILGKPKDEDEATTMLRKLSGREHHVCTGYAIIDNKTKRSFCSFERTAVHFRPLTNGEIERYVATKEPMDKAGAYGVQGKGAIFVDYIKGDYFNVVGLPVSALSMVLKNQFDFNVI